MEATESDHPMHCIVCGTSSPGTAKDTDERAVNRTPSLLRSDHVVVNDIVGVDDGWIHRNIALVGGSRLPLATI